MENYEDNVNLDNTTMAFFDNCEKSKELHLNYEEAKKNFIDLQLKCFKDVDNRNKKLELYSKLLEKQKRSKKNFDHKDIKNKLENCQKETDDLSKALPENNCFYLSIVLGNINLSILDKTKRLQYKENYENFKVIVSIVMFVASIFICLFDTNKTVHAVYQFVMLWYYCTLTIRESILRVNGSRIKGWWVMHHFLSTVGAAFLLVWPTSQAYLEFHYYFKWFVMYISFTYIPQFYYQKGCLYRMKSLGVAHNMHLTVDGFQSWMWTGLRFLLPILILGYIFQFYMTFILYKLYLTSDEWHIIALLIVFVIIFLGNVFTLMSILKSKLQFNITNYLQDFQDKYIMTIMIAIFVHLPIVPLL